MRIILTEAQYELLEMINEAVGPFTTKIVKGGYIKVTYIEKKDAKDSEVESLFKVDDVLGNDKFVKASNKSGAYVFDLGTTLDREKNTITGLLNGQYIPPQPSGEPAQIAGGKKIAVTGVLKVEILDASKNIVDTQLTKLGDERSSETGKEGGDKGEGEEEWSDEDKKDILKMAYNDPAIRKMMYYQPSLLGGLIKLGKAKGVATVGKLLGKYSDESTKKLKKEFRSGWSYSFDTSTPVDMKYDGDVFKLKTGKQYSVRYDGTKFNGSNYSIELKKKQDDGTYKAKLVVNFKEKSTNGEPSSLAPKKEDVIVSVQGGKQR